MVLDDVVLVDVAVVALDVVVVAREEKFVELLDGETHLCLHLVSDVDVVLVAEVEVVLVDDVVIVVSVVAEMKRRT